MDFKDLAGTVVDENLRRLALVQEKQVARFVREIEEAKRIFCGAQGRSGYLLRCFCMRLLHLGYRAHFAGETTTPRIGQGDILVVLSGSGQTTWTCELVKLARHEGATTFGILGAEASPAGESVDHMVCLPGGSRRDVADRLGSVQPAGSLFEQTAFLVMETVILQLFQRQGSDGQALLERHTNLE